MADRLLELSDVVERTIDRAQTAHLNGDPREAQARLREAIRLLDGLAYPRPAFDENRTPNPFAEAIEDENRRRLAFDEEREP